MKCWCNTDMQNSFHPDYFLCPYCGTFVSKEKPKEDYYDFKKYWYDKQQEYNFPSIEQRAIDDFNNRIPFWGEQLKKLPKLLSVLEIGGGHGGFLRYCKEQGFEKCVGIEITEETCNFARKTFGVEMICGEFPYIDIAGQFDLVCGFDVFEHFMEPEKALYKMTELGKYIMIQIPCYRGERMTFCHFNRGEHMFIFNEKSILSLFESVDIKIIHMIKGAFHQDLTIIGGNEK